MTYQIPVFANGARGSAAFFFVVLNPIKLTDPDGRILKNANKTLLMSSAEPDMNLGETEEKIKDVGCVLTTYTRIAIAISGKNITLDVANQKAIDMGLYEKGSDGQTNALSVENGAKLITALIDDLSISVTHGLTVSTSALNIAGTNILLAEGDSREFYATARITTTGADGGKTYGHTLNINSSSVYSDPSVNGGLNIGVSDTSGVRKKIANDIRSNTLQKIDFFQVHRTHTEL